VKLLWKHEPVRFPSDRFLLKRQTPTLRPFLPPHTHDYAEIVYVERGTSRHEINGKSASVSQGDLLIVRPHVDRHCFGSFDQTFAILQVLFTRETFRFMETRYSVAESAMNRSTQHLDPTHQLWFEHNFDRLVLAEKSLFEIERFLLNLIGILHDSEPDLDGRTSAHWLDSALRDIREPRHFNRGVQGFVDLCGRSEAHVERELKKRTSRTISDVVNQARMSWASYMLVYSDAEIVGVSQSCGLSSLGYFYKLFKRHFNETPLRYRRSLRRTCALSGENMMESRRRHS
jgi:AraC family cel operon transcriptional repressor